MKISYRILCRTWMLYKIDVIFVPLIKSEVAELFHSFFDSFRLEFIPLKNYKSLKNKKQTGLKNLFACSYWFRMKLEHTRENGSYFPLHLEASNCICKVFILDANKFSRFIFCSYWATDAWMIIDTVKPLSISCVVLMFV